ncbi:transglutaminase-like domain-containing protein [Ramlibacter albus]|uniref:transglutaminase-like domain-containing protein n=1 Tax=Ramlibacter albus TaxID=2079448 RepID=UPI002107EDA4|nr:transglutaminase-like domain-containing protein [Ramlibacter albus]
MQSLADRVHYLLRTGGGINDPEVHIRALNHVMFREERLGYDHSADARGNILNYFLHGVLARKLGTCVGLPLAYVAVAQRAGFPVQPVNVPDHVFARYKAFPPLPYPNIECTNGGKYTPDERYIRRFLVSDRGMETGAYMRGLSRREHLGSLFYTAAAIPLKRGDYDQYIWYAEQSLELGPRDAFAHNEFARVFASLAAHDPRRYGALRKRAQLLAQRATDLGYVPVELVPQPQRPTTKENS